MDHYLFISHQYDCYYNVKKQYTTESPDDERLTASRLSQ